MARGKSENPFFKPFFRREVPERIGKRGRSGMVWLTSILVGRLPCWRSGAMATVFFSFFLKWKEAHFEPPRHHFLGPFRVLSSPFLKRGALP